MKMTASFARQHSTLYQSQLEHSIRRNFGGFDTDLFNPVELFKKHVDLDSMTEPEAEQDRPPCDTIGLIQASLSGSVSALQG